MSIFGVVLLERRFRDRARVFDLINVIEHVFNISQILQEYNIKHPA